MQYLVNYSNQIVELKVPQATEVHSPLIYWAGCCQTARMTKHGIYYTTGYNVGWLFKHRTKTVVFKKNSNNNE